jgi:hypothetical protein
MKRGRDEAGNIWELDAQGIPVRMIQAAPQAPSSYPGSLAIPPDPGKVREQQRTEQRQSAADARSERADQRAAAAEARAQAKFESEDTMAPPPGDTSKTGEAYLATIPSSLAGQVKAMAEGRRAFPTGAALRSPAVQQLIAAATQYDPTLDAANAATRVATRKDFTSGKSAQNITSLNTVLGHLGSLWKSAQDLHNRSLVPWNAIANAVESTGGDPHLNNYLIARKAVADELERVFRQTGGNVSEIQEWKNTLSSSSSPGQFRGAMAKAVELINSRLDALGAQYNQGMSRSDQPITLLKPHAQAVFSALQEGGSGVVPDQGKGNAAPPIVGGSGPGGGPPKLGPTPDYGQMTGGPETSLATDKTRTEYDPVASAGMNALIRRGRPYEEAAAYAQSKGFGAPDPAIYAKAVAYHQEHPEYKGSLAAANKDIPTTALQRFAGGPVGAALAGAGDAVSLGFNDEMAGLGSYLAGGDYTQGRDAFNARKNILAETHPGANLVGNIAGGVTLGALGAPLAARVPVSGVAAKLAPYAADAGYGAAYGAGENNNDRAIGGVEGALAGLGGGMVGRGAARGLANVIAPPAGAFGPAYAQGVFPTIGQRFGRSGFAGRALNTAEQAMQSLPGLGAMVARARDIPRDAAQLGAFNEGLGELAPFQAAGHDVANALPAGIKPGTEPHAFTKQEFDKAYDIARSGMQFAPDAQYVAEHGAFNSALNSGVLDANQAGQVQRVINTSVGSRLPRGGGVMSGDAYKQASSDINRAVDTWSRNPNTQSMANLLSDYQGIFDAAARRNSNPAAVNLLDATDRGYAKYARVRNASARVGGDPGTFTMKNLQRAVQQEGGGVASGPFNRGQALMQDYSTAVQPLGDTLSNSGTGERLLTNRMFLGEQGAAGLGLGHTLLGGVAAHPGALVPFAPYAPGANALVTRAIAPREYTLPPVVADQLNRIAQRTRAIAPLAGRLAVPATVGWELNQ